jgi:hypothetical protein
MIAKIKGQIVNNEIVTPKEGASYRILHVLQNIPGLEPELLKVKEKELNKEYPKPGTTFEIVVRALVWNFNGRYGLSCTAV